MPTPRSGSREAPPTAPVDPPGIPDTLKEALRPFVDVDEVGPEGLYRWLESVLPILAAATAPGARGDRVRELARALAACGQDRARLNMAAAQYFADNQALARRVKALEATLNDRGRAAPIAADPASARSAERYLPPPRGDRSSRTP